MPYMRFPRPQQPAISDIRRIACQLFVERPEIPLTFPGLSCFDNPYVIAFGFGFFAVFVETLDVVLTPKIVSSLSIESMFAYIM